MNYEIDAVLDQLIQIFGQPRRYRYGQTDFEFNCPICDAHRSKYNLNINLEKKVFHCWSCDYKGKLSSLFYHYGNADQRAVYRQFSKVVLSPQQIDIPKSELSLSEFSDLNCGSMHAHCALNYLTDRGITPKLIKKWNIKYSESGKYAFRIVVPSYSELGVLEYYVCRSFYSYVKPPYLNPPVEKDKIIFGSNTIDWVKDVLITEGVFDAIVAFNAIPLLGSTVGKNSALLKKLIECNSSVVLCLDKTAKGYQTKLYWFLKSYGLRVRCVFFDEKLCEGIKDLNEYYVKYGKAGVLDLLSTATELTTQSILEEELEDMPFGRHPVPSV